MLVAATFIEDKPFLVNCLKLWIESFEDAVDELWVSVRGGQSKCDEVEAKVQHCDKLRFKPTPDFQLEEYIGGYCTSLTRMPFRPDDIVIATDPDVVLNPKIKDPEFPVPEVDRIFCHLYVKNKTLPRPAFIQQKWDPCVELWDRLCREVINRPGVDVGFFNTGVIFGLGQTFSMYCNTYAKLTEYLFKESSKFGLRQWTQELASHSLAVGAHYISTIGYHGKYDAMNTPEHEAEWGLNGDTAVLIHYGWPMRGYDKHRDLLNIPRFADMDCGGPLIGPVRMVARSFLEKHGNI